LPRIQSAFRRHGDHFFTASGDFIATPQPACTRPIFSPLVDARRVSDSSQSACGTGRR
jgi:hypothetical protein